ncbi:MAG TPA: hypothetical protein PKN22_02940, partial [Taishania sp.]|nr:hypothetical protein [Taishania sp.]
RARNLHATAIAVATQYEGKFPTTYAEIIQLKGVGAYTAAAIASFAFNEPKAVVDGNVIGCWRAILILLLPSIQRKEKKSFSSWPMNYCPTQKMPSITKQLWNLVPCNVYRLTHRAIHVC